MNQNRKELLFQLALTKPAARRAAFLDRECDDDKALRARIEALLAANEQSPIMPTDLIHRIGMATLAEKIYRALTTEEGIRAWWTTDVTMDARACGKTVADMTKNRQPIRICRKPVRS